MPTPLNINYQTLIDLLSEAKTEEVLDVLEQALTSQPNYSDYLKEVVVLSNNHNQLQRARRIDIIGFQNYTTKSNQITNALLEIIEDLKEGKAYQAHETKSISLVAFWKIAAILAFILLGILAAISAGAYFFLMDKEKEIQWECPTYSDLPFKVLVLPFHKELPPGRIPPHQHIVSRLENFSKKENLAVDIGTLQTGGVIPPAYTQEEALVYANKCNPDMLVWGKADILDAKTGVVVHYLLTNPTQFEWISDFDVEGRTSILLKDALTPTSFKGATQQIENALEKLLKVTVAFKSKDYKAVVNFQESLPEANNNLKVTKKIDRDIQYMKAESYVKLNEPKKAITTYTKILEVEPDASLALNNRAHLQLEQKELGKALADFNALETLEKATYETYYKKAEIHEQLGNLGAAKKDFQKAEVVSPTPMKANIQDQVQRVEKKIIIKKDKISKDKKPKPVKPTPPPNAPTPASPQTPKDVAVNTLLEEAIDNNVIGAIQEAEEKVMEVLKKQPKNKKALKEYIKTKYFQDNTISLSDLKKYPYLKNIDSITLRKLKDPVLDVILQNGKINPVNRRSKKN